MINPRVMRSRVMAKARPAALNLPARTDVASFARPEALSKWDAGVHAVAIGDNVITMFDVIGADYWTGGGITAKSVTAQLRAIGDRPVEVQINSPGGDMFEGIAIYNILREHSQDVTVKIMGMAASAASTIAMAGDSIEIGNASFLMIHNCWVLAVGNRHDMAATAEWLAPFDAAMAAVYAQRAGQTVKKTAAWMDAETYFNGTQAIELGFADKLLPEDQIAHDPAKAAAQADINAARQLEIAACASMSRTDARNLIAKIKGTPGAAHEATTPGAGGDDWAGALASLHATLTA